MTNIIMNCSSFQEPSGNGTARTCVIQTRRTITKSHCLPFTVLLLLISSTDLVTGFNLDVNFSTIASIPDNSSYFGFSVGLYAGDKDSWLLVGAPKSNRKGEIYKCKYERDSRTSSCSTIPIDIGSPGGKDVHTMFGLTMIPGPEGKELLACAPRFTEKMVQTSQATGRLVYFDLVGVCCFVNNFTNTKTSVYKINPCAARKGRYHDGDDYGQCEVGFSAAFSKGGNNLILGAPRSFYQGSLMSIPLPITNDILSLPPHTGEEIPDIPKGWREQEYLTVSYDENYLGYASASARTITDDELLVVGAPARFRYDLHGMVVVLYSDMHAVLHNFTGSQSGEYFGSAIATTDLNNDGLDDIIIGAPQYSATDRKIYESGRIFIYYQTGAKQDEDGYLESVKFSKPTIIEGTKSKSRFGYTIAAIGDINQDGYQDIAVGAPYTVNQEGSDHADGSVFIFNGGTEGIVIPSSQEIKGIDIGNTVSAFGSSIYGGKDMDRNLYPDIIVGAYLSSHAVMIRSRPIVEITSQITTNPDIINLEKPSCGAKESTAATNCFKITTCFTYTGVSVPESIELSYTYDIDYGKSDYDKRASIFDETPRNVTIRRKTAETSKVKCVYEYAYLKLEIKDKFSNIKIKVSHSLIEKYAPIEPVIDDLKPSHSLASVKIYRDCGVDDICQADLRLQSQLWSLGSKEPKPVTKIYVGKLWQFRLQQDIQNKGESAYQANLVVEYPSYVSYVGIQKTDTTSGVLCTHDNKFVTCEVGNPMKRDADVRVNLKFQTLELNGNATELTMKSFVNSTNPTSNTSKVTSSAIQIGILADINIDHRSSPGAFYFEKDKSSFSQRNTTTVHHTYQVINNGPSDVSKATIQLRWPSKTDDGQILLEMQEIIENHKFVSCSGETIFDNPHKTNATKDGNHYYCDGRTQCAAVDCTVDGIFDQLQIKAVFRLSLATVFMNDYDSYISSEFDFRIIEYPYPISHEGPSFQTTVTTDCIYQKQPSPKEVKWWIIAIAVVAGLLCLFILIVAFWRCGFFKRRKIPGREGDKMQEQAHNPTYEVEEDVMTQ